MASSLFKADYIDIGEVQPFARLGTAIQNFYQATKDVEAYQEMQTQFKNLQVFYEENIDGLKLIHQNCITGKNISLQQAVAHFLLNPGFAQFEVQKALPDFIRNLEQEFKIFTLQNKTNFEDYKNFIKINFDFEVAKNVFVYSAGSISPEYIDLRVSDKLIVWSDIVVIVFLNDQLTVLCIDNTSFGCEELTE